MLLTEQFSLEAKRVRSQMTGEQDGVVQSGAVEKHLIHGAHILDQLNPLVRITMPVGVLEVDFGIFRLGQSVV